MGHCYGITFLLSMQGSASSTGCPRQTNLKKESRLSKSPRKLSFASIFYANPPPDVPADFNNTALHQYSRASPADNKNSYKLRFCVFPPIRIRYRKTIMVGRMGDYWTRIAKWAIISPVLEQKRRTSSQ
ncbi:hypothetical protein CDAR_562871 [Caerostris darwini]|uniref:Secreted protein n=1 Tax=Caerostris darwini TaxID=1538125 RepID=A0AAV4X9N1_9ARAC|nr:hypothetical protein CDAR_562871 [Caerostris darwini]